MEEIGKLRVLFDFTKSFVKFTTDSGIVANLDGNDHAALENKFGIQIIQTDDYDPDDVGFVKWLRKCQLMICVKAVLQFMCNSEVEKSVVCCWAN